MDGSLMWCLFAYIFSLPLLLAYGVAYGHELAFRYMRVGLETMIFGQPGLAECCVYNPVAAEDPLTWFAL
jgi:hypothetical protein